MATPPSSRCVCHRRLSYKQMVQDVADDMGTEDVQKIVFQFDLPADYKSKSALAALRELEVRGKFSDSDIRPLLGLLQSIHRYDLINKHVTPYQEQRFSLRCGCGRRATSTAVNIPPSPDTVQRSQAVPSTAPAYSREDMFETSVRLKHEEKLELCDLLHQYVPPSELRKRGTITKILGGIIPRTFQRNRSPQRCDSSSLSNLSLDVDRAATSSPRPRSATCLPSKFENEVEWVLLDHLSADSGTCSSLDDSLDINIGSFDRERAETQPKSEPWLRTRSGKTKHNEVLWRLKRDQFMVPLFHHKSRTFEKKIKLCLGPSSPCLPVIFKMFPNGIGSDENIYASFRVELPSAMEMVPKGTALSFHITARDLHTADILVSRHMDCPIDKECYTLEQFLAHEVIKSSQARHFEISITIRVHASPSGWVEVNSKH